MNISNVLIAIIPLFLILLLGVFIRIIGVFDWKTTKKLSSFVINITQPALIIASFQTEVSEDKLRIALAILTASLIMHVGFSLLSALLFKNAEQKSKAMLRFGFVFGNCAYMGYPILKAIFPVSGLFYGAVFTLVFNIYIRTYGVYLLSKEEKNSHPVRSALLNPGTISSVIGIMLFAFSIKLPVVLMNTISTIGDMTFPMSMLIVGSILCNQPFKQTISWQAFAFSFAKLLIAPLITLIICVVCFVDTGLTYVCVVMACVPTAASTVLFAEIYNANSSLAASCAGISSLLSIGSIPLMLWATQTAMELLGRV